MLALEAHRGHHQRTVAVKLAVDVAATVLTVPFTLLIEDVVQIRIGAQRGLLAQITLNISTARIGKRGKGEHGHVAELRIAATVIEDCLRGGGIKHSDLGQDRSGLLSRRGLSFGDFLGRLLDGSGAASVSAPPRPRQSPRSRRPRRPALRGPQQSEPWPSSPRQSRRACRQTREHQQANARYPWRRPRTQSSHGARRLARASRLGLG